MFKKIMNTAMTLGLSFIMASSYWDFPWYGNSLFLFGEPEYPTEK